jgi:hypothetical protein
MIDLYLLNTIINIIWYIFTVLFLLYKFTSFFGYIYNFLRFCGKIFGVIHYIYDKGRIYLYRRNGYIHFQNEQNINMNQPKSIFQNCKEYLSKKYNRLYYKIFGKQRDHNVSNNQMNIPLTEISIHNSKTFSKENKDSEKYLFDNHMQELCTNSISIEFNDKIHQENSQYTSNYTSNYTSDYTSDYTSNYTSNYTSDYMPYFDVNYKSSEFDSSTTYHSNYTENTDQKMQLSDSKIFQDITLTEQKKDYIDIDPYQIESPPFVLDFNKKNENEISTQYNTRSLNIILEEAEEAEQEEAEQEEDKEEKYNDQKVSQYTDEYIDEYPNEYKNEYTNDVNNYISKSLNFQEDKEQDQQYDSEYDLQYDSHNIVNQILRNPYI